MIRRNSPESSAEAVQRMVDHEFEDCTLRIKCLRVITPGIGLQWHPWCNPLAIVVLVELDGKIPEGKGAWLSADRLPEISEFAYPQSAPERQRPAIYYRGCILKCEYFLQHGALKFTPEHPNGMPPAPSVRMD